MNGIEYGEVVVMLRHKVKLVGERMATYRMEYPDLAPRCARSQRTLRPVVSSPCGSPGVSSPTRKLRPAGVRTRSPRSLRDDVDLPEQRLVHRRPYNQVKRSLKA